MAADRGEIEGLNEFLKALRSVDKSFSKELREAAKKVATDLANKVKTKARGSGRQAAAGASTVRALSDRIPTIRYGGPTKVSASGRKVAGGALVFGADFGSPTMRQFPGVAGGGRVLWPTVRQNRAEIVSAYMDAIDKVTKGAFPE